LRNDIGLLLGRIRLRRRQARRKVAHPGELTGGNRLQAKILIRILVQLLRLAQTDPLVEQAPTLDP
jgi:hypothetical protein